jgi:hypothetical protein
MIKIKRRKKEEPINKKHSGRDLLELIKAGERTMPEVCMIPTYSLDGKCGPECVWYEHCLVKDNYEFKNPNSGINKHKIKQEEPKLDIKPPVKDTKPIPQKTPQKQVKERKVVKRRVAFDLD